MNARQRVLVAALLALAACSHRAPPGQMPVSVPQAVVDRPPPDPRAEVVGDPPHPRYVWIAGYWNWVSTRHVWVPGFWTRPPSGFSTWEPARWHREEQGWVLIRGHWR